MCLPRSQPESAFRDESTRTWLMVRSYALCGLSPSVSSVALVGFQRALCYTSFLSDTAICCTLSYERATHLIVRSREMTTTIRARMKGGIIEPLDRIDFPEGQDMMITILTPPSITDQEAFRRSAGRWHGTSDPQKLIDDIYADRLVATRSAPAL